MDIKGLWTLVSAKGMDMKTFETVWFTNDEIKAFPDDNFMKMLADSAFEFGDDFLKICNKVNIPEGTPQEAIDEAIASGEVEQIDGNLFMSHKYGLKFEDGAFQVDSGETGMVFDEPINPWKAVEEDGNTLIVLGQYQIVRVGETPSVVRQAPKKEEKVITPEMEAAAGTYIGKFTRFVGDPENAKDEKDSFKLVLNADGTGTSYRNNLEIRIPDWSVEGGSFKMTEKFAGTIDYTGTLSGSSLVTFNGDPENPFTCSYVYEKE